MLSFASLSMKPGKTYSHLNGKSPRAVERPSSLGRPCHKGLRIGLPFLAIGLRKTWNPGKPRLRRGSCCSMWMISRSPPKQRKIVRRGRRNTGEPVHRDRLETIEATYASCPDVKDGPMENGETRFTDGSSYVLNSNRHAGYAVTASQEECQYLRGEFQGPACGRDGPYTPDVFFWCCILFFATFALSSFLKKFKTSRYFPTRVRSTVSDFAVFLTIVIMVLLDFVVGIPSPKLQVPHAFKPTRDDRGWFINPIGPNPWWTVLAALVPALLCTILIFMDQQISAVIVNRKEHKLKKGCGYHLDLFVVAVMLGVCSVMGLPWFVAATVLSITHVNSLKVESDCSAPGEQPKLLGIQEQRVTGLLIFVLMGCSVFFTSVLKFIPMPVLYGVFLYMGVSSLRGIQFFDRLKLFWMPAKHQPDFI
ncbi:electroneutral sodium bicarbonate exchanger 1-like isoform X2 [Accipiter gentilis]|uniref:electroneutral sodium bicarbonate exchanger 1-like isoform X2 n=1 Tax=Astur gentilis TaxID=8957 RepID=UPI00210F3B77|nr:electroneutral sodium bicarbonate exchanger 1-like isoform X2 [Accipiter gentilis]